MQSIDIQTLTANPTLYLNQVEAGEIVRVLRNGQVIAEIQPVAAPPTGLRPFGLAKGKITIADDFNDPLPEEILQAFEGR